MASVHRKVLAVLDDWESGRDAGPYNPVSGKRYRRANALYLAVEAARRGYEDTRWLTRQQIVSLGGRLDAEEPGVRVQYWIFEDELGELQCPRFVAPTVYNGEQLAIDFDR